MGFDENRFINKVDEEFKCSICQDIIENPTVSQCDHIFCKLCISEWLLKESSCPIDRKPLIISQLCEPNRFFRNLYFKLELKCIFESNGCENICKLEELNCHQNECKFNPISEYECDKGCGALMRRNEAISHNCVEYLKAIIKNLREENERMSKRESDLEKLIRDLETMRLTKGDQINESTNKLNVQSSHSSEIMTKEDILDIESSSFLGGEVSSILAEVDGVCVPSAPVMPLYECENNKYSSDSNYERFESKHLIESLKSKGIIFTPIVEKTLLSVDRKLFCSLNPYSDEQRSIGFGSTLSSPHINASILELMRKHLTNDSIVLDIGSGIGYLTFCLAQMVGSNARVIGIEHVKELIDKSQELLTNNFPHLLSNLKFIESDGRNGFPPEAPYDVIIIGGSVNEVPQIIIDQLKRGGRIIAAIGSDNGLQKLVTIDKLNNGFLKKKTRMNVDFESLTDLKAQLECWSRLVRWGKTCIHQSGSDADS